MCLGQSPGHVCVTNLPEVFLHTGLSKVWQTEFHSFSHGYTSTRLVFK